VVLTDCVSKEEFAKKYPGVVREIDSDYIFVCKQPKALIVPLAVNGQGRICMVNGFESRLLTIACREA